MGVIERVLIVLAALLVAGHAAFVVVVLSTRRRRERDDDMFFEDCVSAGMRRTRKFFMLLPGPPRCRICLLPFGGVGRMFPGSPSRQNPNFCRVCFERLPDRGQQMEVGVLFADVRGFTRLAEQLTPLELSRISRRFFHDASEVLIRHDAIIDSFMGDGILALFLSPIPTLGDRTCDVMLDAARSLLRTLSAESESPALDVGVAVHYGTAFVGNLGTDGTKELCAVGDVVTTAARLQQRAAAGEILVSDEAWSRLTAPDQTLARRLLSLRGKTTRVGVRRIVTTERMLPADAVG